MNYQNPLQRKNTEYQSLVCPYCGIQILVDQDSMYVGCGHCSATLEVWHGCTTWQLLPLVYNVTTEYYDFS
jgi:ribosomal protein S27E